VTNSKPSVLLIGGLPRPSGGVTVFLGRLVNQIGSEVDFHVLDIHAGEKEPTLAKSLKVAPRHRLLKQLWLVWHICLFRGEIVHFNYSRCHALVALALLPKLGRRFFVTLHNGSQMPIYDAMGKMVRQLVAKGASKIDCAFSLCNDHAILYKKLGLKESRIVHTKSQIAAPNTVAAFIDERHTRLRERNQYIVVSSGHVDRSYNFEFLVRFVNEHHDCAGLLFFYGDNMDKGYLNELQRQMTDPDRFAIYYHQTEAVFLAALASANAYLRPTRVDSWGIAVADAIALGTPAIASHICERAAGAILCDPNDFIKFQDLVKIAIKSKTLQPQHRNNKIDDFHNAYLGKN